MVLTGVSPAATVGWAAVTWGFGQADHPNGSFTGLAADLAVDSQTHNSVVTVALSAYMHPLQSSSQSPYKTDENSSEYSSQQGGRSTPF